MFKKTKTGNRTITEIARPSVSVWTVFGIVGFLFLVLVFALAFFRYSSFSPLYKYYNPSTPVVTDTASSIQTNINQASVGQSVEIKLTEAQIAAAACVSCDSFPLKKGSLRVTSDGVVISGRTSNAFWGVNLEVTLKPKAKDGKLAFDLTNFQAGGVSAPASITDAYSSKITSGLDKLIPSDQPIAVTEVHSMLGYLYIIGTKK